jgi:hypothetical protein
MNLAALAASGRAGTEDPDPVPGLVLLGLLILTVVLWRRRRRRRKEREAAIVAGLEVAPEPQRKGIRRLWTPAVLLFFLAPYVAEGFSGAAPALIFFHPLVLVYFMLYYGSGAMLIREAALAWNKGWPTVMALGAAYGICEEGLSTKVFFDLDRTNLGPQMQYGTWAGVHWPYAFHLMTYHAVFSITIPIFLTALLFPDRAREPWVRRRTLPVLAAVFVAGMLFSAIRLYPYNPGVLRYGTGIAVVIGLVGLARVLPARVTLPGHTRVATPKRLAQLGFSISLTFWVVSYLFADWGVPAPVTLGLEIAIVVGAGWLILHLTGSAQQWSTYARFCLVGGLMSFFVLGSVVLEVLGYRGQILMGAAGATWLLLLRKRLLRRETAPVSPIPGDPHSPTDARLRGTAP